jgi:hypothetical protein
LEDSLLRPGILDHAGAVTVRVLLADPDSPACRRRAEEIGESAELMAEGTRLCLTHLRDLALDARLDVRLTTTLPVWRLVRLDDVLYVSVSAPTRKGHWSPVRRLVRDVDEPLFTGFEYTYTELFADARPHPMTTPIRTAPPHPDHAGISPWNATRGYQAVIPLGARGRDAQRATVGRDTTPDPPSATRPTGRPRAPG